MSTFFLFHSTFVAVVVVVVFVVFVVVLRRSCDWVSHNEGPALGVGGGGSCLVIYRSWRIVEGRAAEETFFSLAKGREREREGRGLFDFSFPTLPVARSMMLDRSSCRENLCLGLVDSSWKWDGNVRFCGEVELKKEKLNFFFLLLLDGNWL